MNTGAQTHNVDLMQENRKLPETDKDEPVVTSLNATWQISCGVMIILLTADWKILLLNVLHLLSCNWLVLNKCMYSLINSFEVSSK